MRQFVLIAVLAACIIPAHSWMKANKFLKAQKGTLKAKLLGPIGPDGLPLLKSGRCVQITSAETGYTIGPKDAAKGIRFIKRCEEGTRVHWSACP